MLEDGNPAELVAAKGEELWKTKRGPKNASLEQCDLGLGPGVRQGRLRADAALLRRRRPGDGLRVAPRLVHGERCRAWIAPRSRKSPYSGAGQRQTDIEALAAYGVEMSRGMPVNVPQGHPQEKASYDRGRYAFYMRGGPYDFSCATCHGVTGQRIRLQDLPNIAGNKADAQRAFATWPAYRVSQGALRTMQWRLNDCFRQQRFPDLVFLSPTSVDLITFLGVNANGAKMDAPAIKR